MKLINIVYPLTISSGSSSETFYFAEFRINGLNFMSNCDTNNNNITVGFLFNSQYSKSGNLSLTANSQNNPYFVVENPIDKEISISVYNESGNLITDYFNDHILIFECLPYFINDII